MPPPILPTPPIELVLYRLEPLPNKEEIDPTLPPFAVTAGLLVKEEESES